VWPFIAKLKILKHVLENICISIDYMSIGWWMKTTGTCVAPKYLSKCMYLIVI
jgi:hypothetical protein